MWSKQKRHPMEEPQTRPMTGGSEADSPFWHYQVLRQTIQRYEEGQEQSVDWPTAKCELRRLAGQVD
jgi:hypothetical protein